MLHAFARPHHDDWDQFLTCVDSAHNESQQASTGYSPFHLEYGQHPPTTLSLAVPCSAPKNESAEEFAAWMRTIINQAKEHLKAAQDRQAMYANKGRRAYICKPGDKVFLLNKFVSNLPSILLPTTGVASLLLDAGDHSKLRTPHHLGGDPCCCDPLKF